MSLTNKHQSLVALHSAVLLFALSGLFAKWLELPATVIVFGRAVFCALTLALLVIMFKRQSLACDKKTLAALAITGGILAFHWGSFFQAIQLSSVAIGLITFASFPIFVSFLEPVFFKEPFHYQALLQALLTLAGIYLILPDGATTTNELTGALWGIASAFSFAVLTLLNRKFVRNSSAKKVAFYQNTFAALFIAPLIVIEPVAVTSQQLTILLILGVVFTAFAHSLFNYSLKVIKAQIASIAVSLEPIYGIVAAYFFLGEHISMQMVIGGMIVLATNVWASTNR
ncbi:hypothetical protein tinsulaeT_17850 [Thalassotalea insulae]|uniref:EamA domain-containing protein n=1 Tax=Thalassotalea insulae TaxID=2056778 RepID=A0ABQ6GVA9_9GAMM|nr:EamA family transporter [Thalassotalea insulae]GLX78445.1 hypothetical protein tinsulaeT_17850 [Thalassotalea insulae]